MLKEDVVEAVDVDTVSVYILGARPYDTDDVADLSVVKEMVEVDTPAERLLLEIIGVVKEMVPL